MTDKGIRQLLLDFDAAEAQFRASPEAKVIANRVNRLSDRIATAIDDDSEAFGDAQRAVEEVSPLEGAQGTVVWTDWLGETYATGPTTTCDLRRPSTVDDVVKAVSDAAASEKGLRTRGSGHTDNPTARPDAGGILLDLAALALPGGYPAGTDLDPNPAWLGAKAHGRTMAVPSMDDDNPQITLMNVPTRLVYVRAGVKLKSLNSKLDAAELAIPTLGSFDGQTLAGALGTGTHGSDKTIGPIATAIRAIDLVDGTGRRVRIESPDDAITDPAAFAKAFPGWVLQNTSRDVFGAAVVSFGAMGVVVGLVLEVRLAFWLKELRWTSTWELVSPELDRYVNCYERFELAVNPYITDGSNGKTRDDPRSHGRPGHTVLITRRVEVPRPKHEDVEPGGRSILFRLRRLVPESILRAIVLSGDESRLAKRLDSALVVGRVPPNRAWTARAHKVLLLGAGIKAHGFEAAVPAEHAVSAINVVLALTVQAWRAGKGDASLTSPFGVRFVKSTALPLAMQNTMRGQLGGGTPVDVWCMIEIPRLLRPKAAIDALHTDIPALWLPTIAGFGGRPHWGEFHQLDAAQVSGMYASTLANWKNIRAQLDPKGVFSNALLKRVGLT